MKYKNITKETLIFRAHNAKGIVEKFELNPDDEMESDREVEHPGLKLMKEKEKKKRGDIK